MTYREEGVHHELHRAAFQAVVTKLSLISGSNPVDHGMLTRYLAHRNANPKKTSNTVASYIPDLICGLKWPTEPPSFLKTRESPVYFEHLHFISSVSQLGYNNYLSLLQKQNKYTPLVTVYIGCPKQVLILAGSGDHGDNENIFF